MTKDLIILGAGGSAGDVLDIVEAINVTTPTWKVAGFLDDNLGAGSKRWGLPVLGPLIEAARFPTCFFINAISSERNHVRRAEIIATTGLGRERFATLLHPMAAISSRARLGQGVYACQNVSIGGDATIGDHVSLCPGCIVGHDAQVEDYAIVAPGAVLSGLVRVGQAAFIGSRAVVRQCLSVGRCALVGMGAVVVDSVADETTVVGNPARVLPRRAQGDKEAQR